MKRLFLDANVLFTAAHNPAGKAAFVLELGAEGRWELITSALAVEEAHRNLGLKFPSSVARLEDLPRGVRRVGAPSGFVFPVELPSKDRPILAAALCAGATHLLTGDTKHFGPYMDDPGHLGGLCIRTVAAFLESVAREGTP